MMLFVFVFLLSLINPTSEESVNDLTSGGRSDLNILNSWKSDSFFWVNQKLRECKLQHLWLLLLMPSCVSNCAMSSCDLTCL